MQRKELEKAYAELDKRFVAASRLKVAAFAQYMEPTHELQWFHILVYSYLQKWIDKDIRKLAIFLPPQHGKSTMSSMVSPAFILGQKPKAKVVCASYNGSVSSNFNRQAQDIIGSPRYKKVFPNTILPEAGIDMDNELRNAHYFETVGHKGFYKAVGVGGSLTGTTVEYGIIDDPIKDRKEANSVTYRNNLWDWYNDVWRTRLNNESCELMLFTRWHEDDLAGRMFDPTNEHYDAERAKEWTVIVLPALKEDDKPIKMAIDVDDPREVGEALWESKHSRANHEQDQRTNPYTFASLKQQRPAPLEGGLIKKDWFIIKGENEVPFNPEDIPMNFLIDGAFTDKTTNDPTAQMAYRVHKGIIYIYNCFPVRKQLNDYLPFARGFLMANHYDLRSKLKIEYKASGPSLFSMLRQEEYGGFNCQRINDVHVSWGKMVRGEYATPSLASGKVVLIQGAWNQEFIKQCCTFPNDVHDDMFDLLCYSILEELTAPQFTTIETEVNL